MHSQRKYLIYLLFVAVAAMAPASAGGFRPAHAERGMVVSVHPEASAAGVEMMRRGGNAVDAAVATGFALAVVHPAAGNLGGGGFLLYRTPDGRVHFLDYREKAPAKAHRDMYLDEAGNVVPELSTVGYKAAGVPGSVAGMVEAQKRWGKLPLKAVMAPAITLARRGFVLTHEDATSLRSKLLGRFPESKRIFQRDGNFYKQGEVLRQPELARTLQRIAARPADFYKGSLARQIAAAMQRGGGLITAEDMAAYEVKDREPVRGSYRGHEIISAPPPSSGGTALLEILNILEGYDLARLGSRSARAIHLTVEAMRRAFKDRAEFMGDPDFAKVPVAQLIDKKYAMAWRESINPDKASLSAELQRPAAFGELDRVAQRAAVREEKESTTHYSVVDARGGAVAVTTTLNGGYGSGVTLEGLGFLMNNEMDDFVSKPGVPNMYGLIQGEANSIQPGKRPLSAMTPTIVLKDGKLFMVTGSPGGPTIINTVAHILMGVIDYGMDVQQAVNAPRFHHQWMPDHIRVEKVGFSPDTLELLRQMGHKIEAGTSWGGTYMGDGNTILVDAKTGERLGGADQRMNSKAVGY